MIYIRKKDFDEIVDYAKRGLPNEVCGLLGGTIEGEEKHVEKVYYLQNLDQSREHFSMDPKEQLAAVKDIRKNGWKLIGNFHSHPESPSRPSEEDKRLAYDKNIRYLILSLMEPGNPVLNAFIIEGNQVFKEAIVYTEIE
ncbi:MAG: M67 family metallopeptidase [Eubacteriales bacterium]|nr:M67 family metallopeptidase [Eubacteriales bacterium]